MGLRAVSGDAGVSRSFLAPARAAYAAARPQQASRIGQPLLSGRLREGAGALSQYLGRLSARADRLQTLTAGLETIRGLLGDLRGTVDTALQSRGQAGYDLSQAQAEVDRSVATIQDEFRSFQQNSANTSTAVGGAQDATLTARPSRLIGSAMLGGSDPAELATFRVTGSRGSADIQVRNDVTSKDFAEAVNRVSDRTGVAANPSYNDEPEPFDDRAIGFELYSLDPGSDVIRLEGEATLADPGFESGVRTQQDLNGDGVIGGSSVVSWSEPGDSVAAGDIGGNLQNLTTGRPLSLAGDNPEAGPRQVDAAIRSVDNRLSALRDRGAPAPRDEFEPMTSAADSLRQGIMTQVRAALRAQSDGLRAQGILGLLR